MTTKTNTKSKSTKTNSKSPAPTRGKSTTSTPCVPCIAAVCIGVVGAALGACAVGALTLTNIGKFHALTETPTLARAQAVCAEYNGADYYASAEYWLAGYGVDSEQSSRPEDYDVLLSYTCGYNGNPHTTGIEFSELYLDDGEHYLAHAKSNLATILESSSSSNAPIVLENSSTYLKYYQAFPDEQNVYYVATNGDVAVSLYAPSTDIAEKVLVSLGFPNRSRASE
ncbi:hypothetical protein IJ118_01755 [Candidatus Saccharibacteria bacterium]|nr:hypothetical protein [Candidatus Saccharibacteria bacterium]